MIVCIQALQIGMFQLGSMRLSMTGSTLLCLIVEGGNFAIF